MATVKKAIRSPQKKSLLKISSPISSESLEKMPGEIESSRTKLVVGGSAADDASAFLAAWRQAEVGGDGRECIFAFESWEGLAAVLTGERYRLLRYLHGHPTASVMALAKALGRQYRRVHADVTALEKAGLLDRSHGTVRATADRISAEIRLS